MCSSQSEQRKSWALQPDLCHQKFALSFSMLEKANKELDFSYSIIRHKTPKQGYVRLGSLWKRTVFLLLA